MPTDAGWIETSTLPSRSALLDALRAEADLPAHAHPVLADARALARCHERRTRAVALVRAHDSSPISAAVISAAVVEDIDRERATMVDRINAWVATHLAHRQGASLHTETLGAIIDRIAAKWVAAQAHGREPAHALGRPPGREPASDEAHRCGRRLAELADGYQVLVTEVAQHRRRLPVH
ncbi:MAG TPA: DUF4254 domain-containing protein [Nocardia sp.]|uniref:DUF4254 domain-containing protein n=1 Tax=Nocardia TaxID=1817 RepID=UPI002457F003|nr:MULTISPECIES: DUF4254 domain-containing protein [Nocardia]HLS76118.1 DUF4254 domain-containing protein [Nocardia sp.]